MPFGLTEEDYKLIKNVFRSAQKVEEVIIFGSRALSTEKPGSDIDIALVGTNIKMDDILSIKHALSELPIIYDFDIVNYNNIDTPELIDHIDRHGILFYKKEKNPKEWQNYKLGDLISHKKGFAFKSNLYTKSGSCYIIRVSNFTDNSVNLNDCLFIDEQEKIKYLDVELKYGDIVIATVGSWPNNPASIVGRVIRIPKAADGALLNQNAVIIKPKQCIDQKFLYYKLKDVAFSNFLISGAQGSANQASITLQQIFSYELSIPYLSTQQKIATILSSLDKKIELNLRMNETLEAIAKNIFKEWFVDFKFPGFDGELVRGLPRGWNQGSIYKLMDVIYGNPFKSKLFNQNKDGIGLIRIRDLKNNSTGFYTTEKVDEKYLINAGDILAGMDAEFIPSLWFGEPAWLNQRVCKFKPKEDFISELFILYSIKPLLERTQYGKVGTTVIHLGKTDIDKYEIVIPDNEILKSIAYVYKPIHKRLIELHFENRSLTQIRDNLLPKLMSGKITVH